MLKFMVNYLVNSVDDGMSHLKNYVSKSITFAFYSELTYLSVSNFRLSVI